MLLGIQRDTNTQCSVRNTIHTNDLQHKLLIIYVMLSTHTDEDIYIYVCYTLCVCVMLSMFLYVCDCVYIFLSVCVEVCIPPGRGLIYLYYDRHKFFIKITLHFFKFMYNLFMNKKCKLCGKVYQKGIKEWCSNKCYQRSYYREKVLDNMINSVRKCLGCNEDFENNLRFKFCTPQCRIDYWNSKKSHRFKNCKKCGEKFITGKGKLYCSDKCKPSGVFKERVRLVCLECKGEFFGQPHHKYCSKNCSNKVDNRRKKSISKDGKVCEYCGFSDTRAIHAHHISRVSSNEVMFLCANHHYIFHSIVGHGKKSENRSREEVLEVLKGAVK